MTRRFNRSEINPAAGVTTSDAAQFARTPAPTHVLDPVSRKSTKGTPRLCMNVPVFDTNDAPK
jgi:hypothetical protein